jgi:hypothetical protein
METVLLEMGKQCPVLVVFIVTIKYLIDKYMTHIEKNNEIIQKLFDKYDITVKENNNVIDINIKMMGSIEEIIRKCEQSRLIQLSK